MVDSWFGVFSGSALDDPGHIRCVYAPAHCAGASFSASHSAKFLAVQFGRPLLISCCQRLITARGNSRASTPTRRQASGHILSKAWSRRNISLGETSPISELGHWSAAIFNSASSGAISCFSASIANPPFHSTATGKIRQPIRFAAPGHHIGSKKSNVMHWGNIISAAGCRKW